MTQVTIETPTPPAASGPLPGTPEYTAKMAQVFDDSNKPPVTELPLDAATAEESKVPAEGEKKPEDKPTEEEKPEEGDKPSDEAKPLEGLADFADVSKHLSDDGTFKPESLEALTKLGIPAEISTALQGTFQELRDLRTKVAAFETAKLTEGLHTAAGGKSEFDALIAWGKANLTADEKTHLDGELNGPFAAQAIELLKLRRGKGAPSGDPQLHTPGSAGGSAQGGYASAAEQQADFSNPKYQTDPAFRQMVARRLRLTK